MKNNYENDNGSGDNKNKYDGTEIMIITIILIIIIIVDIIIINIITIFTLLMLFFSHH